MVAEIDGKKMYIPDTLLGVILSKKPIGFDFLKRLKEDYPENFDGNEIVWVPVEDAKNKEDGL